MTHTPIVTTGSEFKRGTRPSQTTLFADCDDLADDLSVVVYSQQQ